MPRKRRQPPTSTKASESVVSRMLAKLLGVPPSELIEEVCVAFSDLVNHSPMVDVTNNVVALYPWNCEVAREIMSPSTSPLVEHLISRPGQSFVVKDTERQGADSIWVAVADPPAGVLEAIERMQCRGLFHTFCVGSEYSRVIAIQLSSCRP